jgi:hypothetical protein
MGELRRHVEGDLSACQFALDEEAQADAAARSQYGDEWRMPTSATLAKHYWEKLHSYRCVRVRGLCGWSCPSLLLRDVGGPAVLWHHHRTSLAATAELRICLQPDTLCHTGCYAGGRWAGVIHVCLVHARLCCLPNISFSCCSNVSMFFARVSAGRSTMAQAGESDGKVIQRLRDNEAAFAALTPDAAANQLPRLQVRKTLLRQSRWLELQSTQHFIVCNVYCM